MRASQRRPPACLALLACLALPGEAIHAAQVVGREVPLAAASPHPYPSGGGDRPVWDVEVAHPGATYVAIHFDRFELAPGDRVVVRSPDGRQRHAFTGRGKGGLGTFWATHVKGEAAVVELFSPLPAPVAFGVSIDRYAAGTGAPGTEGIESTEALCGSDDKANAICYLLAEPVVYERARAVARLLINGTNLCTGFLLGGEGHLMTNQHCIDSQADAFNTDYEFMALAPDCSSVNCRSCWTGTFWSGTPTLIRENVELDYALIHLAGDPQATFGSLVLEDRDPILGERIYIPQHPDGRAKEIAVTSSDPNDTAGVCEVFSTNEDPCQPLLGETVPNVGYYCDTERGSSGSPVLAYSSHQVIALHHCAFCPNRAIPIRDVVADLASLSPPEVSPPGAAVPFRMGVDAAGGVEFELLPDPDVAYHLYSADDLAAMLAGDWTHKVCDLERNPFGSWSTAGNAARWTPATPSLLVEGHWVVVAERRLTAVEGPYGTHSDGTPRPPDADGIGSGFELGCPARP